MESNKEAIAVQVQINDTVVFAQTGPTTFQVALFPRSLDAAESALKQALESIERFRILL
jgi:hypothetical protein